MTNQQRRLRINQLTVLLAPLKEQKFMTSLEYNSLVRPFIKNLSRLEEVKAEALKLKLSELDEEIIPLITELRSLQIRYWVEYDAEVLQNGELTTVFNKKELFMSTDAPIDMFQETPDFTNEDVKAVLNEIAEYIYQNEYSDFTILAIKKL